jgi:hypothetical protein
VLSVLAAYSAAPRLHELVAIASLLGFASGLFAPGSWS